MPDHAGQFKGITIPRRPEVKVCPRTLDKCRCLNGGTQHEICKFNLAQETRTNG